MKYKFSVIIPVYNKEKFVEHCLLSILKQSYKNYEVVIVNDGSTDSSISIIQNFISRHCLYNNWLIIEQDNKGVSSARNTGIEKSVGRYISFIDSDDVWDENYLYLINKMIENTNNRVFGTNYKQIPKYDYIKKTRCIDQILFEDLNYVKDKVKVCSSSICIDKNIFENKFFLFDTEQTHGEDTDVWFRVSLYYNITYSDLELVYYVQEDLSAATAGIQRLNYSKIFDLDLPSMNTLPYKDYFQKHITKMKLVYARSNLSRGENSNIRKIMRNESTIQGFLFYLISFIPPFVTKKLYIFLKAIKN